MSPAFPPVDVAVIGAGAAGLAAAIRCRWPKGHGAMASSVRLFDPAPAGGLSRWKGPRLTGPSWNPSASAFLEPLLREIESLSIPIAPVLVDEVARDGRGWICRCEGRSLLRARAVILATGFRPLCNEAGFLGRGLHLAYQGLPQIPGLLRAAFADGSATGLLIVGRKGSEALLPLVDSLRPKASPVRWLLDEVDEFTLEAFAGRELHVGRPTRLLGDTHLEGVEYQGREGPSELSCGALFLDYLAFEGRASTLPRIEGLTRNDEGFPLVNREGACSLPGLFAAGDGTGDRAFALKALAEGVTAGLSAHCHVFAEKFGPAPSLFAYAPAPSPWTFEDSPWPNCHDGDRLEALLPPEAFARASASLEGCRDLPDCPSTVGELRRALGPDEAETWLQGHFENKLVTLHPGREHARD